MAGARHLAFGILAAAVLGTAATLVVPVCPAASPRGRAVPAPRPRPAVARPAPMSAVALPFVVRRVLNTGGAIRYGDWFWDDRDVPTGPILVTVDLDAQVLSIFRSGYEIGTTAVIHGADDHPTPLGTFPIMAKYADHVSSTYDGAPMPYTLRLTADGVSIHGAGKVGWEWASHGCVGVPVAFARKLFAATAVGDRVVITRGRRMAVPAT